MKLNPQSIRTVEHVLAQLRRFGVNLHRVSDEQVQRIPIEFENDLEDAGSFDLGNTLINIFEIVQNSITGSTVRVRDGEDQDIIAFDLVFDTYFFEFYFDLVSAYLNLSYIGQKYVYRIPIVRTIDKPVPKAPNFTADTAVESDDVFYPIYAKLEQEILELEAELKAKQEEIAKKQNKLNALKVLMMD